jgi:hypothetical protein
MNTCSCKNKEWYEIEKEKSTENINQIINVIQINKDPSIKSKLHKVSGTYISIYSNISGELKTHRYFLLYPFDKKTYPRKEEAVYDYEYDNPIMPYQKENPYIFMKDFYFYADILFYRWMFDRMIIGQNKPIFASLNEDNIGWKITSGDLRVSIISFESDFDKYENFDEWYKTEECNINFELEITNPFLYIVPFPVRQYKYKYNKTGENYLQLSSS